MEDTLKLEGKTPQSTTNINEPYTGDPDNLKNYKKFKGTTKDGMLPGNESIDNYFTKDVSTTGKYDEIIDKWVYHTGYKDVQYFEECGRDIEKLRKALIKDNPRNTIEEIDEMVENIVDTCNKFDELMKDGELKKNMVLHRTQEKLHMGNNPKPGDTVTLSSYRSTAISEEGVDYYRKGSKKDWWDLIIYAPAGTKGVYISPKAINPEKNNKYIRQMETILGPDTKAEILEIKTYEKEIYLKVIK